MGKVILDTGSKSARDIRKAGTEECSYALEELMLLMVVVVVVMVII